MEELVYYLAKIGFILLGIISILVGKHLSLKIIMPKIKKYKVIDEINYIKYSRMIFYGIGIYYIVLGTVLLFINGWLTVISTFGIMLLPLIIGVISRNRRKYIKRIND
ncbi:hypothetical protein [Clostridium sp.]|uniref:hypothetical protein n=1 Tax=Clostridium sp. TaxID=1506 RepID=UPI003D6D0AFC